MDSLWGVRDTHLVYTTKDKAETVSKFLKDKWNKSYPGYSKTGKDPQQKYAVFEIYPDCYVKKIENGADTFRVWMTREGKILRAMKSSVFPNAFGYKSGMIVPYHSSGLPMAERPKDIDSRDNVIHYACLAMNEKDAIRQADEYRVRRFIDDIWFAKEPEAAF